MKIYLIGASIQADYILQKNDERSQIQKKILIKSSSFVSVMKYRQKYICTNSRLYSIQYNEANLEANNINIFYTTGRFRTDIKHLKGTVPSAGFPRPARATQHIKLKRYIANSGVSYRCRIRCPRSCRKLWELSRFWRGAINSCQWRKSIGHPRDLRQQPRRRISFPA